MIHGVCHVNRGVPNCIIQEKVTQKADVFREKGRVNEAVSDGNTK